jgi:hypothetical protein
VKKKGEEEKERKKRKAEDESPASKKANDNNQGEEENLSDDEGDNDSEQEEKKNSEDKIKKKVQGQTGKCIAKHSRMNMKSTDNVNKKRRACKNKNTKLQPAKKKKRAVLSVLKPECTVMRSFVKKIAMVGLYPTIATDYHTQQSDEERYMQFSLFH